MGIGSLVVPWGCMVATPTVRMWNVVIVARAISQTSIAQALRFVPSRPFPRSHITTIEIATLGCRADGVHDECRFCGEAPFESVQCPRPHEEVEICQSNIGPRSVPYFWDESCVDGMLGCL